MKSYSVCDFMLHSLAAVPIGTIHALLEAMAIDEIRIGCTIVTCHDQTMAVPALSSYGCTSTAINDRNPFGPVHVRRSPYSSSRTPRTRRLRMHMLTCLNSARGIPRVRIIVYSSNARVLGSHDHRLELSKAAVRSCDTVASPKWGVVRALARTLRALDATTGRGARWHPLSTYPPSTIHQVS